MGKEWFKTLPQNWKKNNQCSTLCNLKLWGGGESICSENLHGKLERFKGVLVIVFIDMVLGLHGSIL